MVARNLLLDRENRGKINHGVSAPTVNTKGNAYLCDADSSFWVRSEGGAWFFISSPTGTSLDLAYDGGRTITADVGAVEITSTNASNNTCLLLVQNDITNNPAGLEISNTGTGYSVLLSGTTRSIVSNSVDMLIAVLDRGDLYLTAEGGGIIFDDGNKDGSTYSSSFFLSSATGEWDTFETNFGEVSLLAALNASFGTGFNSAENMDVDIATSPETIDSFTTATLGGSDPMAGHCAWEWFAMGQDDSSDHVSGGRVSLTWDSDLTYHLNTIRDWDDGSEITFSVVLTNPATDTVMVKLQATTTVDNYAVKVLRFPCMTAIETV